MKPMAVREAEGVARRTLQLGGACGIASGLLIIVALLLALTVPQGGIFADVTTLLTIFPASRTTIVTIVRLSYVASFLFVPFLVALFESLGKVRPATARLGTLLGTLAAGASFAFALGYGFTASTLADAYAAGSPQERTTIVYAADAALGVVSALQVTAIFFFGFTFLSFGVAIVGHSNYHRAFGWASVLLGVASVAVLYTPGVPDPVAFLFVAVFALMLGAELLRLSRMPSPS